MGNQKEIVITTRDKLLRSWENSKELSGILKINSKEIEDDPRVAELFAGFAEDEALHASRLRELLHEYQG